MRSNALAQLLVQLSERDAFNELRTQQQLGYVVFLFRESENQVQSISLVVQVSTALIYALMPSYICSMCI